MRQKRAPDKPENSFRKMRKSTGMSRKEFSEYTSIPEKTIERWEYGITQIPKPTMELLQRVLVAENVLTQDDILQINADEKK